MHSLSCRVVRTRQSETNIRGQVRPLRVNTDCGSTQYTLHSVQRTVHRAQYTVHTTQCTVHSTRDGFGEHFCSHNAYLYE
jgi:hypothetical protein